MVFDYSFNTHKIGRDDNRFVGKVIDAKHWKPQNDLFMITGLPNARVKIRIIGADPENTTEMADEDARWALVAQPPGVGGGSGGSGGDGNGGGGGDDRRASDWSSLRADERSGDRPARGAAASLRRDRP